MVLKIVWSGNFSVKTHQSIHDLIVEIQKQFFDNRISGSLFPGILVVQTTDFGHGYNFGI